MEKEYQGVKRKEQYKKQGESKSKKEFREKPEGTQTVLEEGRV